MTKKLFALVLALCMLLSLAACSESEKLTQEALKGTWDLSVDFSKISAEMDMSSLPVGVEGLEDLEITVTMEFDGKDNLTMKMSTDAFNSVMDKFLDSYMEYMRNGGIYEMMAESYGADAQYVKENFEALTGMNVDSYLALVEGTFAYMDYSELIALEDSDIEVRDGYMVMSEGSYKLDGNDIIIVDSEDGAESAITVKYDSGEKTMEIVDYDSDEEGSKALIGCILRKQ